VSGIAIQGLRFERDGRTVLDLPALEFPAGSTTAIFGPNGSGKSTLLRLIAGLERPSAGAITIGGAPPSPHDVAFAFQEAVFLRGDVRSNLALGLELRGVAAAERAARIGEVARECGIEGLLGRRVTRLSSGEAQRVNLARTLALRAPVTLLDEPLAGVDRIGRQLLLDDLPRLVATFAATALIVTHDREEAFRLADRLVVVIGGSIRASGEKGDVYRRPADAETAALLGYTVLPVAGGAVAIAPGGLRRGSGRISFRLAAGRVVDMGNHRHLSGSIDGVRAELRLLDGESVPAAGTVIDVHAPGAILL
jgi:thiamine transport system ATP-binding protein